MDNLGCCRIRRGDYVGFLELHIAGTEAYFSILVYVGDAATLSFLQLLRLMLEPMIGHTAFTDDPRRHMITESQFSLDPNTTTNTQLPDYRTARVLAESFFTNVSWAITTGKISY